VGIGALNIPVEGSSCTNYIRAILNSTAFTLNAVNDIKNRSPSSIPNSIQFRWDLTRPNIPKENQENGTRLRDRLIKKTRKSQ
jgi:hypothetical protein